MRESRPATGFERLKVCRGAKTEALQLSGHDVDDGRDVGHVDGVVAVDIASERLGACGDGNDVGPSALSVEIAIADEGEVVNPALQEAWCRFGFVGLGVIVYLIQVVIEHFGEGAALAVDAVFWQEDVPQAYVAVVDVGGGEPVKLAGFYACQIAVLARLVDPLASLHLLHDGHPAGADTADDVELTALLHDVGC